jgi:putative ABC transport system ATP-binding protein
MSTSTRQPLVQMRHAWRTFETGATEVVALRDVTLDVFAGEMLVVTGPSGSGKSTLLNLVGGLDRADRGEVFADAEDLALASDSELTRYRRHHVGFVFQFYNLIPTLTAAENVQMAADLAHDPIAPNEALALVGLTQRASHFPSELSGGEQQRVAIARAVAGNPPLLLCDEPTGALDVAAGRDVIALLNRLKSELDKAVVIITHNLAIAEVADVVASMRDGAIEEVRTNPEPLPIEQLDW